MSLDSSTLSLAGGESRSLTATVLPATAYNKNVSWYSSNETAATVDQSGNVLAHSPGNATITVTTQDGGKTATCVVTVEPAPAAITISSVSAANGTVIVTLSGTLSETPGIGDFTLTQSINGAATTPLTPTAISSNGTVVTLTVPQVTSADVDQTVVDTVSYKNGAAVTASSFTVPKNSVPGGGDSGGESFPIFQALPSYFELF